MISLAGNVNLYSIIVPFQLTLIYETTNHLSTAGYFKFQLINSQLTVALYYLLMIRHYNIDESGYRTEVKIGNAF